MAENKLTLMEKIVAIMSEVEKLQKDDNVEFGKTKYKALSEEKVTTIMHEKLVKYKIVVIPISYDWNREGTITHVDAKYRIINAENPEDFIEVVSCGDGADTQDKGSGKAMTYAYKYMWLRTFAIPTGEDPDKVSSDQLDAEEAERKKKAAANQKVDETKVRAILDRCNGDEISIEKLCALYKINQLEDITEAMFVNMNANWDKIVERCK